MPCARAAVGPQRTEQESDRFVTLMYDSHLGLAITISHHARAQIARRDSLCLGGPAVLRTERLSRRAVSSLENAVACGQRQRSE